MRTLCLIALLGLAGPVAAQEAAPPQQPPSDVDEVVVPGRVPEKLYVEIERLEGAVYERFNALNSNDELDIRCFKQEPTGSNIPLRRCAPNFVIEAEAEASTDSIRDARSGGTRTPTADRIRIEEMSRELTAQMQRIAREDEQLLKDLVRLDELRQLQAGGQVSDTNR